VNEFFFHHADFRSTALKLFKIAPTKIHQKPGQKNLTSL
jgi:hypothetical protein